MRAGDALRYRTQMAGRRVGGESTHAGGDRWWLALLSPKTRRTMAKQARLAAEIRSLVEQTSSEVLPG